MKSQNVAIPTVDNEKELQSELENYFERHGWIAIREVSPHNSDYRADLVVNHDRYGWIGIETKYFEGNGGGKVANAHHQIISKYRGKKYLGNKIDLWAFCPYFSGFDSDDEWTHQRAGHRKSLVREFFCKHGVGFIDILRNPLIIDFAYSIAERKIPIDTDKETRHHRNVKIDEITESVEKKIDNYAYKTE